MGVIYMCKICGREHVSPAVATTREIFESSSSKTKSFKCLATGRSAQYSRMDMRWKTSR
jgi:hypothetical protein